MAAFALVLPIPLANIALGSTTEEGILWKILNQIVCSDDIKSNFLFDIIAIDKNLGTASGVIAYANEYTKILNKYAIQQHADAWFIILLLCLIRDNIITIISEDELIENSSKYMVDNNRRAMILAISEMLCTLYQANHNVDARTLQEIADRVYESHKNENWQDRDYANRIMHAQAIVNTILRILGEYNNLTSAGVRVHANAQLEIPSAFELLIRVLVTFYGVEMQLTAIRSAQYAYEHGAQGVFPAGNEISPFFIGDTPP
jgi:hypothetical protein